MPNYLVYDETKVMYKKSLSPSKATAYTAYQRQDEAVDASKYDYSEADGFYVMTDDQITAKEEAAETAYQAAKSTAEKQRDNWVLEIIESTLTTYPDLELTATDIYKSVDELAPILVAAGVSASDCTLLLQAKTALGSSILPEAAHDLTEATEEETTETTEE